MLSILATFKTYFISFHQMETIFLYEWSQVLSVLIDPICYLDAEKKIDISQFAWVSLLHLDGNCSFLLLSFIFYYL